MANPAALAIALIALLGAAKAQEKQYPKPTELPNPYRLVEGWPALPKSMNGGRWGEVIRVHVDANGNVWVFHRCFQCGTGGISHLYWARPCQSANFGIQRLGHCC
jgi:hypothetical protein